MSDDSRPQPDSAPDREAPPPPERHQSRYSTPRLTVHGPVPESTQTDDGGLSNPPSDRALKQDFAPVDPRAILAGVAGLPIRTWSYKADEPWVRHLGPMAQDFAAAFGVGEDDRHIHPVDANGVALAAIQALHRLVEAQELEIGALRRDLEALRTGRGRGPEPAEPDGARPAPRPVSRP